MDTGIKLLKSGQVTDISLDHDLGDDNRGTGYDVILWIEEAVICRGFKPPRITVHSSNSSARQKMELGIQKINGLTHKGSSFGSAENQLDSTATQLAAMNYNEKIIIGKWPV